MRVLHDAVLVKIERARKTAGGIILSERAVQNAATIVGKVLQIGDGEFIQKHGLKFGDRILIYAAIRGGFPAMPNAEDEFLIPNEAILGVLEAGD